MDRGSIERHLAETEREVMLSTGFIARQKEIIARLEASGLDTIRARRLLRSFEDSLAQHLADRDRLRFERQQGT